MITLFYGNDTIAVRQQAMVELETLREQGLSIERLESKDITTGKLIDMAGSISLFGEQTAYLVDTPSEEAEKEDLFLEQLSALSESTNRVVVIETSVLAPTKKRYEKSGAKLVECKKSETVRTFDPFLLCAALLTKDKKTMWMLLVESLRLGISAEETVGVIWWQLKTLRLADLYHSAEAAGLKSYPYDKAKRALKYFAPGELVTLSNSLLQTHHDSRSGKTELALGLERWVLGL